MSWFNLFFFFGDRVLRLTHHRQLRTVTVILRVSETFFTDAVENSFVLQSVQEIRYGYFTAQIELFLTVKYHENITMGMARGEKRMGTVQVAIRGALYKRRP